MAKEEAAAAEVEAAVEAAAAEAAAEAEAAVATVATAAMAVAGVGKGYVAYATDMVGRAERVIAQPSSLTSRAESDSASPHASTVDIMRSGPTTYSTSYLGGWAAHPKHSPDSYYQPYSGGQASSSELYPSGLTRASHPKPSPDPSSVPYSQLYSQPYLGGQASSELYPASDSPSPDSYSQAYSGGQASSSELYPPSDSQSCLQPCSASRPSYSAPLSRLSSHSHAGGQADPEHYLEFYSEPSRSVSVTMPRVVLEPARRSRPMVGVPSQEPALSDMPHVAFEAGRHSRPSVGEPSHEPAPSDVSRVAFEAGRHSRLAVGELSQRVNGLPPKLTWREEEVSAKRVPMREWDYGEASAGDVALPARLDAMWPRCAEVLTQSGGLPTFRVLVFCPAPVSSVSSAPSGWSVSSAASPGMRIMRTLAIRSVVCIRTLRTIAIRSVVCIRTVRTIAIRSIVCMRTRGTIAMRSVVCILTLRTIAIRSVVCMLLKPSRAYSPLGHHQR